MRKIRLAAVATHPIQYQVPVFRVLAADPEVEFLAIFGSRVGLNGTRDREFGVELSWDVPLLDGYPYRFLRNCGRNPTTGAFGGLAWSGLTGELRRGRFDAVLVPAYRSHFYLQAFLAARQADLPILYRPTITDLDVARLVLDDYLETYRAHLPQFWD